MCFTFKLLLLKKTKLKVLINRSIKKGFRNENTNCLIKSFSNIKKVADIKKSPEELNKEFNK